MRVLVIGATGYLGSWVCKELRARKHAVWAHNSRDVLGWIGDACVSDAVVLLGWASTARCGVDHESCFTRTRILCDYVRLVNPECKLVFASSCAVYGHGCTRPRAEMNDLVLDSEYARFKRRAERVVLEQGGSVLRLGSLMGRGWNGVEKTDVTVNAFAADAYTTRKVTCWGPEAFKPLVHVRDAAEVVCRAVEEPERWAEVTNVCWENMRAGSVADVVACGVEGNVTVEYADAPVGRPSASVLMDSTLLRTRLGPEFKFRTLEEAAREFEGYVPQPGHKFDPARWSVS